MAATTTTLFTIVDIVLCENISYESYFAWITANLTCVIDVEFIDITSGMVTVCSLSMPILMIYCGVLWFE